MRGQTTICGILVAGLAALSGCGQPPEPTFVLSEKTRELIPEARGEVQKVLLEDFGTPNHLVAWQRFPIDYGAPEPDSKIADRHQAGWRLLEGRNLYMQQCVHCHGTSGDGNGPTAKFLNPLPRDYRQGVFKFKSTKGGVKPARADLVRILEQGIPGTYMPSFVVLGEEQLELLADYVRWLSARGEVELKLYNQLAASEARESDVRKRAREEKTRRSEVVAEIMKSIREEFADMVAEATGDVAESWAAAEDPESVVIPKTKRLVPRRDSLARGREIFLGDKTKCADCHGVTGRGDGPQTEKFQPIPNTTPERKYEVAGLHDIWGHPQQPRTWRDPFTAAAGAPSTSSGVFTRINGTQMPGFSTALTEEQMWDLVNYVMSIPFDGKESAYPTDVPAEATEKSVAASK